MNPFLGNASIPAPASKNAFAEGAHCAVLYEQIYLANQRLCDRLSIQEDPDVELIVGNFFEILREVSIQMFIYGQQFSHTE